uniref:NAC-A/B domain-containing protein n=1 Tax=Salix viminalis TaxID=40686 RepID=A0A6N2MA51_SALVM
MDRERLMKMAGSVRTGGKGSVRRELGLIQFQLKYIFKDDLVIQFVNPKVQASVVANTWVIAGTPQTRKLQDILPGIINQLGPDNLDNLRKLAEQFQKECRWAGAAQADDDDDVPELVAGETFEAAAEEGQKE